MKRLEELGRYLTEMARGMPHDSLVDADKLNVEEAAAILLAASKVDVAGLMKLAEAVAIASDEIGRAELRGCRADYQAEDKAFEQLETALRMALAVREWQGLTTEDTMTAIVINQGGEEFVKGVRWAEAKLKEKNAGGTND